jgi:uncharacterized protein involved in exopolysaccharide biosynthesis
MTTETPLPDQNENAASARPTSGSGHGEVSALGLLIAVAERKRIVLWVTAIFVVAAVVISLLLPKRYTASVTLMPPQESTSAGAALASQLGNLGGVGMAVSGLGIKNPNDRYVSMLQSRTVEDSMVQHFGLMQEYKAHDSSEARVALEGYVNVDGSGKDGLIRISVEDRDPRRAAELANGFVDQFRNLSQHLALSEASQRRLFFEQELEQAKDKLADAEEALKQTEQSTGVIQPESQERALIESASTLRAQIAAKEVQIQGMQTYATGENSQLVMAQSELEGLRAQLAKLGGTGSTGDELMVSKGRAPEAGMEYVRKLRDVKYYETIFDILARQFEVAKVDEAKQGALIQVIDPAVVPNRRSFPKRGRIVIISTGLGFILGIAIALLQAVLQQLKNDPETNQQLSLLRRAFSFSKA